MVANTGVRADEIVAASQKNESPDAVAAWLQQTSTVKEKPTDLTLKRNKKSPSQTQQRADGGATSLPYGKMMWPLAAVLGTIALAAWGLRKWAVGGGRLGSTGAITVLARHYLSSKRSLCLVRLGRRVVLLGVTPEHIGAVADLGDADEAAALMAGLERTRPGSFSNAMAGFSPSRISDFKQDDAPEAVLEETSGRVQSLVDRLKVCGAGS